MSVNEYHIPEQIFWDGKWRVVMFDFIGLVRAHLKSGTGEMLSFVAEALESDRKLREHFRLP